MPQFVCNFDVFNNLDEKQPQLSTMASRQETAEEFSSKMADTVSGGYLCLALALGNRSGLWDAMASFDQPKTVKEVADAAGLKPR